MADCLASMANALQEEAEPWRTIAADDTSPAQRLCLAKAIGLVERALDELAETTLTRCPGLPAEGDA